MSLALLAGYPRFDFKDPEWDRVINYWGVLVNDPTMPIGQSYQSGTFGGSNILEPPNFIFNILESNEEKKL